MRKTEFIQKYLGSPKYPFCDANREAMYDDLCAVIEREVSFKREQKAFLVELMEEDEKDGMYDTPCCPYEDRTSGGRCNNCGDPPNKHVRFLDSNITTDDHELGYQP